jgi:hypothetical protein
MTSRKPGPDTEPETIRDTIPAPKEGAPEGPPPRAEAEPPHVEAKPSSAVEPLSAPDRLGEPPNMGVPAPSRKTVTKPSSPRAIRLDDLRKALEDLRGRHDEIFPPPSKEDGEK